MYYKIPSAFSQILIYFDYDLLFNSSVNINIRVARAV